MTIAQIEKPHWRAYFDRMSRTLVGNNAELEVDSLALGSQVAAEWIPFIGVTYDQHDDVMAVMMAGLGHNIRRPKAVYVDVQAPALSSMEVIDAEEAHHIIKLRDPVLLGAPH